ncbi:uncharacterized protein BXZ73DRAFT_104502 [Epithele typhae]|uniref:uncharacterized protein n=1 Tax=Epithele typhae TaxID=378194 RepID=UPI00200851DA|nr:uncharacterized protein BXZ73DRAFT_104502 [Epithele typhae]KAH9921214.1 hypothetical protein BXZ73DRAFT_104502 [Epithele typhae]
MPPLLLSLNEDVLFLIFSLLKAPEALAVACCSKAAYRLAISQVFFDIHAKGSSPPIEDQPRLAKVCSLLLSCEPVSQVPRVHYLRRFTLDCEPSWPQDFAPLFTDFLFKAVNLQFLLISYVEEFIRGDSRLGEAIGALSRLEELALHGMEAVATASLPVMLLGQKLTDLHLEFGQDDLDLDFVIRTLASLPLLDVLHLFLPESFSQFESTSKDLKLPQVHRLHLSCPPSAYCAVTARFSALVALDADLYFWRDGPVTGPAAGSGWPALQKLTCVNPPPHVRVDSAGHMHNVRDLLVGPSSSVPKFTPVLHAARPVVVEFETSAFRLVDHPSFWPDLCRAAPQLRSLRVTIHPVADELHCMLPFVAPMLDALSSISLLHLSLLLPFPPRLSPSGMHIVTSVRKMELRRLNALRALPRLVTTNALPSLRVLHIGPYTPRLFTLNEVILNLSHGAQIRPKVLEALEAEERGATDACPELEQLRKLKREMRVRDERWWWVGEDGGGGRTLDEMWREDGERACGIICGSSFNANTSFEGFFTEKRRSRFRL